MCSCTSDDPTKCECRAYGIERCTCSCHRHWKPKTSTQGPKQPPEEKDAEIERLRLGITTVRGCIIGALAGGHMEGNDGASYSKQVLLFIAETLGIDIPDIVKGERQG